LDSEERRRFAQVGHEYLIEQLQFTGTEPVQTPTGKYKLDFNHPSKELIWAVKNGNYTTGKKFVAYTHLNDWQCKLKDCAAKILCESIALLNTDSDCCNSACQSGSSSGSSSSSSSSSSRSSYSSNSCSAPAERCTVRSG